MGYENARSTVLLATHCLCCGLPLRDPISVESGVGPICRAKYGFADQGDETTRAECSKLIHTAAQKGLSAVEIFKFADQIEALGFPGVAIRVRERFHRAYEWETRHKAKPLQIRCETVDFRGKQTECVLLHTPWEKTATPTFNSAFKEMIPGSGRTGLKKGDVFWWVILPEHKRAIHGLLLAHFEGRLVVGPKGNFIVGEEEKRAAAEKAAAEQDEALAIIAAMQNMTAPTTATTATLPVTPCQKIELGNLDD